MLRLRSRSASRRIGDIRQGSDELDKNLSQLVDPVMHQHVARARDRRRPMRHFIDRRAHGYRTSLRQHPSDRSRRGELAGEALHKNCPNLARLHTVGETIDGFGFQTRPTAQNGANGT